MITIDKDIEIPRANIRGRKLEYPIFELNVGDSFFVAAKNGITLRDLQVRLSGGLNARIRSHKSKIKISTRQVVNGTPGVRVWRVK